MATYGPYVEVKDAKGKRNVPIPPGPLTVGRNITNLLVIDEPLASRFHCVIEKLKVGFRVRDLGSSNGLNVNGKPTQAAIIGNGDLVTIGATVLRLVVPSAVAEPAARKGVAPPRQAAVVEQPSDNLEPASLDDIVEGDQNENASAPIVQSHFDWERALRERADALLSKPFRESDIALINARGQVSHPPLPSGATPPGGEAVLLLRLILLICFRSRATDIHVELKQDDASVRIRVDGVMLEILRLPAGEQRELAVRMLSLVKILSDIDIAQRNIVQEGSFNARVPSGRPGSAARRVDYRVSFAPAVYGQKLVIRILDTANSPQHLADLQLSEAIIAPLRRMMLQESGMILACGPTGSGKTTTLYAMLRDIDLHERNVVTIEDPVEIQLEGVTQIPVNEQQGNSFSNLLKSVLRQDPDIILVGEIRDAETSRTAMQSAMTGHLVFSTVHARDAVGAVYRLLDLGVEPYLVSSGLQLVLAQRLVRQLCKYCKTPTNLDPQQTARMAEFGITDFTQIFNPKGCRRCLNTGFFGRRTVVELLSFNQALREVILKTPTMQEIVKNLGPQNYIRLAESGYRLVAEGITSFDEADRAVM
jgi:type II secretory ATPase GspE/PulE/Tfp pilus assembly ATPase PilB-like protein/pSer/pThr/pTyr-binding forkhead associated (FHA) protein